MLSERNKLVKIMSENYVNASKKDKGSILDSLVRIALYSRKYASSLLSKSVKTVKLDGSGLILKADPGKKHKRKREKIYGDEIKVIILFLWRTFDYPCSDRLHSMLPCQIKKMDQFMYLYKNEWNDKEIKLTDTVKNKLNEISISTIERMISVERKRYRIKGVSHTKPGTLLKDHIQIRTFADWNENRPGFTEVDLVGHEGGRNYGEFCFSLNATDINTGWTETQCVRNKAQIKVFEAIKYIRSRLPFPLKGIDSDNGTEFINGEMIRYCEQEKITFTRSRKNYKNDQCYIEQKNWSIVRKYVGYARYDSMEELNVINELYKHLRLFTNYFLPVMQMQEKIRIGAFVKKRYDTPRTPYQRILESPHVSLKDKEILIKTYQTLNPFELKKRIRYLQIKLREVRRRKEIDQLHYQDKIKDVNFQKEKLSEEMKKDLHPYI